jgi:hypothetical protein
VLFVDMDVNIKTWLNDCALVCEREKTTLVPVLQLIYCIYNDEYSPEQATQQLRCLTKEPGADADLLFKAVRKYAGQALSYRRWITTIMPFPSTAHFEILSFGKRLDKRSKWAKLGNKSHGLIFNKVIGHGRISPGKILEEEQRLAKSFSQNQLTCLFEAFYSFRRSIDGWKFTSGIPGSWFEYTPSKPAEIPETGTQATARSWNNKAIHNSARFASWILTSSSVKTRNRVRAQFLACRESQRESILSHLSDACRADWLAFVQSGGEPSCHAVASSGSE